MVFHFHFDWPATGRVYHFAASRLVLEQLRDKWEQSLYSKALAPGGTIPSLSEIKDGLSPFQVKFAGWIPQAIRYSINEKVVWLTVFPHSMEMRDFVQRLPYGRVKGEIQTTMNLADWQDRWPWEWTDSP